MARCRVSAGCFPGLPGGFDHVFSFQATNCDH